MQERETCAAKRVSGHGWSKSALAQKLGISARDHYHWIDSGQLDRILDVEAVCYKCRPVVAAIRRRWTCAFPPAVGKALGASGGLELLAASVAALLPTAEYAHVV